MIYHVNGWPFIALYLKRRGLRQTDLAALLKITPAAISQRKSGRSLFNPVQLSAIADFLAFDDRTRRLFYEELFAARMGGVPPSGEVNEDPVMRLTRRIPCCPLPVLLDYAPAAENLRDFVMDHHSETLPADRFSPACVAARAGLGERAGLPAGTVLTLPERPDLPADRCTVLGCDDAGLFVARMIRDRQEGVIWFQPLPGAERRPEPWHFRREPGRLRFLLPIRALKLADAGKENIL